MKSRGEIESILLSELYRTRRDYEITRKNFDDGILESSAGLLTTELAERTKSALRENSKSYRDYSHALSEYSDFLTKGKVPERFKTME